MNRISRPIFFAIAVALVGLANVSLYAADEPLRHNVVLIMVDDLRPTIGCYDDSAAKTPHLDALASEGVLVERAYCQISLCNPSRASMMTGKLPDRIKVWDLKAHFRETHPDIVTLPQHFKANGYHTQSFGKIFHGYGPPAKDPPSWSVDPQYDVIDPSLRYLSKGENNTFKRGATEALDVADNAYVDGQVCDDAVTAIQTLSQKDKPFFLAVGFRKPHLPFTAPRRYWDLYQRNQIPQPRFSETPDGAPELATRSWLELEGYSDVPDSEPVPPHKVAELRHGYYACVSYIDALIGRVTKAIQQSGDADRTLIVVCGDHGFHLGEQAIWTKANNFELATRVPLIISGPGVQTDRLGRSTFVELVDLYPTLSEMCGLPHPQDIDGRSFSRVLRGAEDTFRHHAISQFPRHQTKNRHAGSGDIMGYSIRTQKHRYVEWQRIDSKEVVATELYDLATDDIETTNIASMASSEDVVVRLQELLQRRLIQGTIGSDR